jgi:hypothetical protein
MRSRTPERQDREQFQGLHACRASERHASNKIHRMMNYLVGERANLR